VFDRDTLLASVDLRDLADDLLGPGGTNGRARMWSCPNPNHAQTGRTPPVSIFNGRRGEQRWRCHGCGDGGTAIDLVLACRGGSLRDAMSFLAERGGHGERPQTWRPSGPRASDRTFPAAGCTDPDGLDRYVRQCAERLWAPEGRHHLRWLTNERGLPTDLLVRNLIGSDPGASAQPRPDGMPRAAGVVLPVVDEGIGTYAQIRVPHPTGRMPRYLNPASRLANNPRLSRIRPAAVRHPEVIVTEGAIDALSAAAAGYRAVGVLSAAYGDEAVAVSLARLPHPLVLAFDADDAGRAAAERLAMLLEARQRLPVVLDLGRGDLNLAMLRSGEWETELPERVAGGVTLGAAPLESALSR